MRLRREEQLDRLYMRMACRLAAKAAGRTSPNPMVGAVLLRDGKIIARYMNAHDVSTTTPRSLRSKRPAPRLKEPHSISISNHAIITVEHRHAPAL